MLLKCAKSSLPFYGQYSCQNVSFNLILTHYAYRVRVLILITCTVTVSFSYSCIRGLKILATPSAVRYIPFISTSSFK